jgi:hypothetical protein
MVRVWRSWGARMGSKVRFVWERAVGLRREKARVGVVVVVVVVVVEMDLRGSVRRMERSIFGTVGLKSILVVLGGCGNWVMGIEVWSVDGCWWNFNREMIESDVIDVPRR